MCMSISEERKSELIGLMTKNLVTLRTVLRLTQTQLADYMGITRQTLVYIETGKRNMTWNTFLSLLFIFTQRKETRDLLSILGVFTDDIRQVYCGNEEEVR